MTPVARLGPPQSRGLPAFHRQARDWRTCTSSLMLDASRIDELYGRGAGGAFDSLMPLDVFGTMAVRARGSRHSQLLFGCCRCDLPRPCRSRDTSFKAVSGSFQRSSARCLLGTRLRTVSPCLVRKPGARVRKRHPWRHVKGIGKPLAVHAACAHAVRAGPRGARPRLWGGWGLRFTAMARHETYA